LTTSIPPLQLRSQAPHCHWLTISIIMPVFNSGPYLVEAMKSIDANVCADVALEVVMVDDCSSDPITKALMAEFATRDGIKVVYLTTNGGPARARNAGIRAATGDWIGFLDADDLFTELSIARRRDVIQALPDARWIACDILEMRKLGEPEHFHSFHVNEHNSQRIMPGVFQIRRPMGEMVAWQFLPPLGAMMIRRDLLAMVGFFGEDLHYGEDIHFCLLVSTYADLFWIAQPGMCLRRHHESMTKNLLRMACESPRYTRRLVQEPRLHEVRKQLRWRHAAALRHMSKLSLIHNRRWPAFYAALFSIFWTPNSLKGFRLMLNALLPRRAD